MLVDDIEIKVTAGSGGSGAVAFNKNLMEKGPTGGSGGSGGDIYVEGVTDIGALRRFKFKKDFYAENGRDGRSQFRDGVDGKDLTLYVPTGTVVYNLSTKDSFEVNSENERVVIARGGTGGKGNFHFRSSKRTSPKIAQKGKEGESFKIRFELKLIADIGLVGLPNVGKSSMLNEFTNAKSRVGNYPFTTLEPALGAYYNLIIADIPGLIKGAHRGKGLGVKFLKHIERTKILFHLISAESKRPIEDYRTIREELKRHNKELLEKREYLVISKKDMVSSKKLEEIKRKMSKINNDIILFSAIDDGSISSFKNFLSKIEKERI